MNNPYTGKPDGGKNFVNSLTYNQMLQQQNAVTDSIVIPFVQQRNSDYARRQQDILNSIDKIVSFEDEGKRDTLRNLLIMTAHMENSMGADPSAYGRNYTNSFMSIDDGTFNQLMDIREGAYDYTSSQKAYQKRYGELGLPSDKQGLLQLLEQDNPDAAVAVARQVYGMDTKPLPENTPKGLFDYYMDVFNKGGSSDYGTREKDFKRFMVGYNKNIK